MGPCAYVPVRESPYARCTARPLGRKKVCVYKGTVGEKQSAEQVLESTQRSEEPVSGRSCISSAHIAEKVVKRTDNEGCKRLAYLNQYTVCSDWVMSKTQWHIWAHTHTSI